MVDRGWRIALLMGCAGLVVSCGRAAVKPEATTSSDAGDVADALAVDTGAPADLDARSEATVDSAAGGDSAVPQSEAGAAADGGPCGVRSGHRGLTSRSMTVAGLARTYRVYLPASLDPGSPVPFVFVHHGLTMSGQAMVEITQYTDLADAEGIGVAFPDGQSGPNSLLAPWNVGPGTCPGSLGATTSAPGDDFAFLDAMEADVAQDQCLDTAHVFVTGFSMGGFFAHQVACMRPDIRAVAPHSGGTHDLSTCAVARKPIIIFHGASDPIIADGCDDPNAGNTPAGWTPSAEAWAAHNGCSNAVTTMAVSGGTCSYYQGCPPDGQVALCVLSGMGHCWAGGAADGGIFSCPGFASATQLQWQFYKQYAW